MIFCGRERIIISYTLKISYLDDDDLYLVVMGSVPFFASMGRDLLFCIYRFLNWGKKRQFSSAVFHSFYYIMMGCVLVVGFGCGKKKQNDSF